MKLKNKIVGMMVLLTSTPALTAGLSAPMSFDGTAVLPKGIRNLRYTGVMIKGEEKFNKDGQAVTIASPFFKDVKFKDLIKGKDEAERQGLTEGYLRAHGFKNDEIVGKTNGDVSVSAAAHVAIFGYGLTPKITLAGVLPVVKYKVNVATGFESTGRLKEFARTLEKDGRMFELTELGEKMADPIGTKLEKYNYQALKNEQGTKIGDAKIVAKYQAFKNDKNVVAVQGAVTLPTGVEEDINKALDIPTGDGQTDIGLGIIHDFKPSDKMTLTSSFEYTYQTGDEVAARIPEVNDSKVTGDIDDAVQRKLGNVVKGQFNITYNVFKGITLGSGYTYQHKKEDKFSGSKFSAERYEWMGGLGQAPEQSMQSLLLQVDFSTIPLFKEKKFPVPLKLTLNHALVVGGKNVSKDPRSSLDFALFF
ncbi:hypothetical protein OAK75_04060 [Bacteriovoracales bacterium]|nr:hypothetical protein [Bacteriovoracales bacterium]